MIELALRMTNVKVNYRNYRGHNIRLSLFNSPSAVQMYVFIYLYLSNKAVLKSVFTLCESNVKTIALKTINAAMNLVIN